MAFVKNIEIVRRSRNESIQKPDLVAIEEPLEIRVGYGSMSDRQQKSLSVTMRTPGHDFELALGFLFTEGIIHDCNQVESIKHCEDVNKPDEKENVVRVELQPDVRLDFEKLQRHFYTSSSCGVCGKSSIDSVKVSCSVIDSKLTISANLIHDLPQSLRKQQAVFEHTGGLHASALFDDTGKLLMLREDVGRHNALDKIVGASLLEEQTPLSNRILLLSGRASFELIQKAAVAGIPIVAAVGAPSSLAVQMAGEMGMTLLGFVRDEKFNVYSHSHRVR